MRQSDTQALVQLAQAAPLIAAERARRQTYLFHTIFPDTGPLRRELYVPHMQFIAAGRQHRERAMIAANRVGKTMAAGYEVSCHLTGRYPDWWPGYRFDRQTRWWVAGDTMETTRDITQQVLMGPHELVPKREWDGARMLIPPYLVYNTTRRVGAIANCLGAVYVKHVSGGISVVEFKSYDQGQKSFQGTERDGIWLDEEPPDAGEESRNDIYTECLLRTMTTGGMVLLTYTPLRGLTPFVEQYLQDAEMPDGAGGTVNAMRGFWPEGLEAAKEVRP